MRLRLRAVLQEFEAHLQPAQPGSKIRGKSEWKQYGDGSYRFKLSLRDIALPDESQIDLWRETSWLMRLRVQSGRARVDIENDGGSDIPAIEAGQVLQIKHGDLLLAQGESKAE